MSDGSDVKIISGMATDRKEIKNSKKINREKE